MAKATKPVESPIPEANSNVLVIEFGEDTKHLIRELTQALANKAAPVINLQTVDIEALVKGLSAQQAVSHTIPSTGTSAPVKVVAKPAAPTAKVVESETKVSLTQIRELITSKVDEGKSPLLVELFGKFGAKNASTLPEEHFAEFYQNLLEL